MNRWRSMKTAPRDGTPILCWWDLPPEEADAAMDVAKWEMGEWVDPESGDRCSSFIEPKKWMPLPKSPRGKTVHTSTKENDNG